MNSIVVAVDCESFTPGLGKIAFIAGQVIEPGDPSYFPLLWAGLAKETPGATRVGPDPQDISARLKADRDRAKES
jgi:hypothetical protein